MFQENGVTVGFIFGYDYCKLWFLGTCLKSAHKIDKYYFHDKDAMNEFYQKNFTLSKEKLP